MVSKWKPLLSSVRSVGGRRVATVSVVCSLSYKKERGWLPKGRMGLKEVVLFRKDSHV